MANKKAEEPNVPTLGQPVTSHGDELKNNTYARAIGYGYLLSGLVKVILERDGESVELHFTAEQLDVHINSLKAVQKLARNQQHKE